MLLKGALAAETKVLLKMNVSKAALDKVSKLLPSLHAPTVNPLSSEGWYSIESVVDEPVVRVIIPQLKEAGAEGIIEIPLNKVVP
jgi:ATP phosphoribosyltransferase